MVTSTHRHKPPPLYRPSTGKLTTQVEIIMGLFADLRSLLDPTHRASRRQAEQERHDHARQNSSLLDIALKRGRMRSFTPEDLPEFYRLQEQRRAAQAPQTQQQAEDVSGDEGTLVDVGSERGSAVLNSGDGDQGRGEDVGVPQGR